MKRFLIVLVALAACSSHKQTAAALTRGDLVSASVSPNSQGLTATALGRQKGERRWKVSLGIFGECDAAPIALSSPTHIRGTSVRPRSREFSANSASRETSGSVCNLILHRSIERHYSRR